MRVRMLKAYIPSLTSDVDERHNHRDENCDSYDTVERKFSRAEIRRLSTGVHLSP